MASKYNAQRKQENLKLAQEMMGYSSPSVNREGKQLTMTHKGGRVVTMPPFKYDPQYIKKLCGLNTTECRIIGLYPSDIGDAMTQMIRNKIRNGFRHVKDSVKKTVKTTTIKPARAAGRGE